MLCNMIIRHVGFWCMANRLLGWWIDIKRTKKFDYWKISSNFAARKRHRCRLAVLQLIRRYTHPSTDQGSISTHLLKRQPWRPALRQRAPAGEWCEMKKCKYDIISTVFLRLTTLWAQETAELIISKETKCLMALVRGCLMKVVLAFLYI